MAHRDIPSELGPVFAVHAAREVGVSRGRLRARDLQRPFHGARVRPGAALIRDEAEDAARAYPRSAAARRVHESAAHYAAVMSPTAFFFGVTAATLWDAPMPAAVLEAHGGWSEDGAPHDCAALEVAVFWPQRAPRGRGIRGHAIRPALAGVSQHPVSGLRVTSPASTWAALPSRLRHPYDLVAVADFFVRVRRAPHSRPFEAVAEPLSTVAQLTRAVDAGRRIGAAALREALPRARIGSASRTETWTRLTLVDAGLPEPVLDHDVFDASGRFVATVDMAYPRWRIAVEYDGAHHGLGEQWEKDIDRLARLEAAGWLVVRVTRTLLFNEPRVLIARVRRAIAERAH